MRPINGQERISEKANEWNSGSVKYTERINAKDKDVFVAGNRDSIGTSSSILKQLTYKGYVSNRLGTLELDYIIQMKNKYVIEDATKSIIKGFIQTISVHPVTLFLWMVAEFCIFHDLCKIDAVTWNPTSNMVKARLIKNELLYYEISIRNPSTGHILLPVAVMISSN